MFRKKYTLPERRRYIRLDTVFPVQFRITTLEVNEFFSEWLQGFTNNIGKGGMCLAINNLPSSLAKLIKEQREQVRISLKIEMPLIRKIIPALAKIAWIREITDEPQSYLVGLSYEQIDPKENNQLMRYAWTKKLFVPVVLTIIFILGLGFLIGTYLNVKLIKGNKALVEQLVKIVQESSVAKQKVKEITRKKNELQLKIQALQSKIQTVESERAKFGEKTPQEKLKAEDKIAEFDFLIENLGKEKDSLEEELIALQQKESMVTDDILHLDKKKAELEKANLDKMYQWLCMQQEPRTGLVMSFKQDNDSKNLSFLYDQSLVLEVYTYFADFSRAKKILDFFKEKAQKSSEAMFFNAYYANSGLPAEYIVHSGPNIWLGIAILQYTIKANDVGYLNLARDIADKIISLQDEEGGIRAGPDLNWFVIEYNLDAYAFFNFLYQTTTITKYQLARDKVLNWLLSHVYEQPDIPLKYAKDDSTIATDIYAWSIAAIGPEKLEEIGVNPDRIMEFAQERGVVETEFNRPEGYQVKIKGFNFAPKKNLARGGVVFSEWTAQMVIFFKIMADYYYKRGLKAKGHAYEMKAHEYLATLGKMIISSPSGPGQGASCLPYASQSFVDTGGGWMTPQGDSLGSLAGTVYTIFAYYGYNPLGFNE
jgi:hypothetical protein